MATNQTANHGPVQTRICPACRTVHSGDLCPQPTATSDEKRWTTPFHGVQHHGYETRHSTNGRWATVTNWGEWAELDGWYQGCGFTPYKATFDTIEEARAAGEAWTAGGVFPQQVAA